MINRKCCFFIIWITPLTISLISAEQDDIEFCEKILQLHPDFRAFMRGLSRDEETDAFNRFLGMVYILYMAYMR